MALFAAQAKVDIIVVTGVNPEQTGAEAGITEMVDSAKSGSVVVDLASQNGGNNNFYVPGVVTTANGVKIGYTDLPGHAPTSPPALRHQHGEPAGKLLCKGKAAISHRFR